MSVIVFALLLWLGWMLYEVVHLSRDVRALDKKIDDLRKGDKI